MIKVLITDPISDNGIQLLEKSGIEVLNNPDIDSDDLIKLLGDIDGWIIRSGTKITKEHIGCSSPPRSRIP